MQFAASTVAGLFLCINAGPVDMIMVKLTTQSTVKEEQKYNGILGTAMTIMREEGIRGFYRGFIPAWQRVAPLIVI
jgi:hypothetical protein